MPPPPPDRPIVLASNRGPVSFVRQDDGSLASRTYLDVPLPGAPPTDEVLVKLLQQRAAIEEELAELKVRRAFLQTVEFQREFERLMVELARVNRDIRARIKS